MTPTPKMVKAVADKILANLKDRSGVGDELDGVDREIYQEIRVTIGNIAWQAVTEEMAKATRGAP